MKEREALLSCVLEIREKLKQGLLLSDDELMKEAVEMAKQIADKEEKTFVLSGILVFADKIIDTETAKYIKEVVRMTQVAELLLEEGREEGRILTVKIFQETQQNPQCTIEQIAEKVGCKAQEVTETLKMFGM